MQILKRLSFAGAVLLLSILHRPTSAVSIQPSHLTKNRFSSVSILQLRNGAQEEHLGTAKDVNFLAINDTLSDAEASSEIDKQTIIPTDLMAEKENNLSPNLLKTLQLTAFLQVFSNSICMFAPTAALVGKIGSSRATSILSILSASAAFIQILFAPIMGSILDSTGRKPTMFYAQVMNALLKVLVALNPTTFSLCAAKFMVTICSGFSALSAQAVISDIAAFDPSVMSSAIGFYMATLTCGFLVGSVVGGKLSEFGLPVIYGVSSIIGTISVFIVKFALSESLPVSKRIPYKNHDMKGLILKSPMSSIRLLTRHSKEVRNLSIVLMLLAISTNMGDFFQVFAKQEWKLTTKDFSYLIAMYGVLGIVANVTGSILVKKIGIKRFTGLAIVSNLMSGFGAILFGIRGLIIGNFFGFLGSAQTMGILAALISEGVKTGAPLGELAGERSSLLELLKVIGPIWYR